MYQMSEVIWKSIPQHQLIQLLLWTFDMNYLHSVTIDEIIPLYFLLLRQRSLAGGNWGKENSKSLYINMCSYYSKGTADYVGVWDFEDFFIPRGANQNVLDVLKAAEYSNIDLASSSNLSNNQSHPFCYLLLASEDTYIDAQPKGQVPNL